MSRLLDTDVASAYLQGKKQVFNRFVQHGGGLYISIGHKCGEIRAALRRQGTKVPTLDMLLCTPAAILMQLGGNSAFAILDSPTLPHAMPGLPAETWQGAPHPPVGPSKCSHETVGRRASRKKRAPQSGAGLASDISWLP